MDMIVFIKKKKRHDCHDSLHDIVNKGNLIHSIGELLVKKGFVILGRLQKMEMMIAC